MKKRRWEIVDHLCVKCGGRILKCISGNGMTPEGNPIYRCADCGASSTAIGGTDLCWCGLHHKNQSITAYCCVPFSIIKDYPEMEEAFFRCGCDPKRGEVGVVLERELMEIIK